MAFKAFSIVDFIHFHYICCPKNILLLNYQFTFKFF